ncbi:hypothetical protein [Thiocapsa marina]|uniref:YokE-like PH domain-containing protein n=1 Tax=Thiocapsa marina 5811 TaxID=768671 RepID=F9U5K9_9GAMM|nr:hypothetical protein [Thiocapsa marina]EGV20432.1 hypothetical protein ThimaDRAFT_0210 [Thiocapsa marina 5811]
MNKTFLYRLLGFGAIPKKILPVLQEEGVVVCDEGIGGRLVTKNVKGPGKRYIRRSEGFSGCLVITKKRILCFTYAKRQINIGVDDPRVSALYFDVPDSGILLVSFESSVFRDKWDGVIEFKFKTEKARQFGDALKCIGARQGTAAEAKSRIDGL